MIFYDAIKPRWSWDAGELPCILDAVMAAKRRYKPYIAEKDTFIRDTLDRWIVRCIAIRDSVPLYKVWFRKSDGTEEPVAILDRNNPYIPDRWWIKP